MAQIDGAISDDGVNLRAGLLVGLGVLDQVVDSVGKEVGGSGGANEDVDDLVEYLGVLELLAAFGVHAVHDGIQHVLAGLLGVVFAAVDDILGVRAHGLGQAGEAALVQPVEQLRASRTLQRLHCSTLPALHHCPTLDGIFALLQDVNTLVEEALHAGR